MRVSGVHMPPRRAWIAAAAVLGAGARPASASVVPAGDAVSIETRAVLDSVTVGQRFRVTYHFGFADSLRPVIPEHLDAGTCRALSVAWDEHRTGPRVERTASVTFIPLSIASSVVPANRFDFVTPRGDTLRAWSDSLRVPIRRIAAGAKDLRPLKQQWSPPPNYWLWAAIAAAVIALAAALVWWVRRRRSRARPEAPEVRLPPEVVALAELERIAGLGLVARGEHKTHYTLVVDVLRRYLEARFGVEAMDRTTFELLDDLERRRVRVDGLAAALEEADLVKFAKLVPTADAGLAALARARDIVIATTPRVEPAAPGADVPAAAGEGG